METSFIYFFYHASILICFQTSIYKWPWKNSFKLLEQHKITIYLKTLSVYIHIGCHIGSTFTTASYGNNLSVQGQRSRSQNLDIYTHPCTFTHNGILMRCVKWWTLVICINIARTGGRVMLNKEVRRRKTSAGWFHLYVE